MVKMLCLMFLGLGQGTERVKIEPIPPAEVVMTGKAASFMQTSNVQVIIKENENVEKKLKNALSKITATTFRLDDDSGLVVALPAKVFDLKDFSRLYAKTHTVEGILSVTKNPIMIAASGQGKISQVPILVAEKITLASDRENKDHPKENRAKVTAIVREKPVTLGKDTFGWVLENSDHPIPFRLALDAGKDWAGKKVSIEGKARITDGVLWLDDAKPVSSK